MLQHCSFLKHKNLIGLLYRCGLRCLEVRSLRLADLDFDSIASKSKLYREKAKMIDIYLSLCTSYEDSKRISLPKTGTMRL